MKKFYGSEKFCRKVILQFRDFFMKLKYWGSIFYANFMDLSAHFPLIGAF